MVSVRLFVVTAKKREVADIPRKHPREAEPSYPRLASAWCYLYTWLLYMGGDHVGHCEEMAMDDSVCSSVFR